MRNSNQNATQRLNTRKREIEKLSNLRRVIPQETHSLSGIQPRAFADPKPEPTPPEKRPYHAVEETKDDEEIWANTNPDKQLEVTSQVFLTDSFVNEESKVKDLGWKLFFEHIFKKQHVEFDKIKVNDVQLTTSEYRAIVKFIRNTHLSFDEAPPKTEEFIYFIANDINKNNNKFFFKSIEIPTQKSRRGNASEGVRY